MTKGQDAMRLDLLCMNRENRKWVFE